MGDGSERKTSITTTKSTSTFNLKIQHLFKLMVDSNASDLHITVGTSPCIRVNGEIVRVKTPPMNADDTKKLIYQILSPEQQSEFENKLELDFSFGVNYIIF